MATKKALSARKLAEQITSGINDWTSIGCDRMIGNGSFSCKFPDSMTKADILRRASALDRACYDRKVDGGKGVQSAMKFILEHKDIANGVTIAHRSIIVWEFEEFGNFAMYGKKNLGKVGFTQNDYEYALYVLQGNGMVN